MVNEWTKNKFDPDLESWLGGSIKLHLDIVGIIDLSSISHLHIAKVLVDCGLRVLWASWLNILITVIGIISSRNVIVTKGTWSGHSINASEVTGFSLVHVSFLLGLELRQREDTLTLTGHNKKVILIVEVEQFWVLFIANMKTELQKMRRLSFTQQLQANNGTYFRWRRRRLSMVSRRESIIRG